MEIIRKSLLKAEGHSSKLQEKVDLFTKVAVQRSAMIDELIKDLQRAQVELHGAIEIAQKIRRHEKYEIAEGSTGHTPEKMFATYVDSDLKSVSIEEPWLNCKCHLLTVSKHFIVCAMRSSPLPDQRSEVKKATRQAKLSVLIKSSVIFRKRLVLFIDVS